MTSENGCSRQRPRGYSNTLPPTVNAPRKRVAAAALLLSLATGGCGRGDHVNLVAVRANARKLAVGDSVIIVRGTLIESDIGLSLGGRVIRRIADATDTLAVEVRDTLPLGQTVTLRVRVHQMVVPFGTPVVFLVSQKSPSLNKR